MRIVKGKYTNVSNKAIKCPDEIEKLIRENTSVPEDGMQNLIGIVAGNSEAFSTSCVYLQHN